MRLIMDKNIIILFITGILAKYTNIIDIFAGFMIITIIDTLTAIHCSAIQKGIKFNPLLREFWTHISSSGLRRMAKKVFGEYFVWLIVVFVVDHMILNSLFKVPFFGDSLYLPVALLYFFTLIEIRSIGENLGKAGKVNWLEKLVSFLPKDLKSIYKKISKLIDDDNKKVSKDK